MTRPTTRAATAVVFGALLTAGTACGAAAEKVGEKAAERALESQGGGNVDLDVGGGGFSIETEDGTATMDADGNMQVDTADGSFSMGSGEVPAGWPGDIGFPSGAEVLSGIEQSSAGESFVNVTLSITGSPDDVVRFYEDALSGWSTENESSFSSNGAESRTVTFVTGDRRLDVYTNASGDGSVQATLSHTVAEG